jgi:L-ascorbate metabolism protein UlaG (beta-lactamase superfamily)
VGIQWLGYSCFYIDSPGGVAVVTDPFDPKATGLAAPTTGAHFITVSEETPQHNFAGAVHAFQGEQKEVLHGRPARRGDLQITPVPTDSSAGGNVAYVIQAGALRIAHLGALDHPLSAAQVKSLGQVDVLMLPVGGGALSPKQAVAVTKALNPRIVLPMAYSTPGMSGPAARLPPLQDFISASPYAVTRKDEDVMMISKADLPQSTEIYTLKYGR